MAGGELGWAGGRAGVSIAIKACMCDMQRIKGLYSCNIQRNKSLYICHMLHNGDVYISDIKGNSGLCVPYSVIKVCVCNIQVVGAVARGEGAEDAAQGAPHLDYDPNIHYPVLLKMDTHCPRVLR